ncbi:MAG TPA: LuxR C-terminal-related transcriptional regulator [Anaerolineae bacterium]|nr:LuxR C-terminal-related transcriptional regulator [Anaerolineae bacterium]
MTLPLLTTKFHIPPARTSLILRPRLFATLDTSPTRKLTLISAAAGFGKTTLLTQWLAQQSRPAAWLSLDDDDNDPHRFWCYLIAALQTILPTLGQDITALLQSPQPPPIETILPTLINTLSALPQPIILVLDDYHLIDNPAIDDQLAFFLKHLPPSTHLIISTRQDPPLPLGRLRASYQLTEIRTNQLRFTPTETDAFIHKTTGFTLSPTTLNILDKRAEGWITGLQLASLSLSNQPDATAFIQSLSGNHRFILDYLLEEVLHQQPPDIQHFLLHTAILNQLSPPLCQALLTHTDIDCQQTLAYLDQANLFIIPLDNERRWYRYHHLFADLLRQRLSQHASATQIHLLHDLASHWYEQNKLLLEAFHHATATHNIDRITQLILTTDTPLYFRGVLAPIRKWLDTLPTTTITLNPTLALIDAWLATLTGLPHHQIHTTLTAAENSLASQPETDHSRDLHGQIATIRAMLHTVRMEDQPMITHAQRALGLLHPHNAAVRTLAHWSLGFAYQIQRHHDLATQTFRQAIAHSQKTNNNMGIIAASTCLGQIQEADNQLTDANASYQQVITIGGQPPIPATCEAYLGQARLHYQWNQLATATQQAQLALNLASQLPNVDTPIVTHITLGYIHLAQDNFQTAHYHANQADKHILQNNFSQHIDRLITLKFHITLQQQGPDAAARLLHHTQTLPLARVRLHLAQNNFQQALNLLSDLIPKLQQTKQLQAELQARTLQALTYHQLTHYKTALGHLRQIYTITQPHNFIRLFVNLGQPMQKLLQYALNQQLQPTYTQQLLSHFPALPNNALIDPLTDRELEILTLIAHGLTNRQIADKLFLSPNTIKVHTRNIYSKLDVRSRTQAVAQARTLNLIP